MNDRLLPDGLPSGRLIVPNPSYVDGEALGPVLWVSDVPVEQPGEWWHRLRAEHWRAGLRPLVLETLNGARRGPGTTASSIPGLAKDNGGPADVNLLLEALSGKHRLRLSALTDLTPRRAHPFAELTPVDVHGIDPLLSQP